jgi:rubrerythrin
MISAEELRILSFYRASELAGAVLLGRFALHTKNDRIRIPLTEQCAEEARHAWLFTDLIRTLGHAPVRMTETYQSEVAKVLGLPESVADILCLTQLLEVEALAHYRRHAEKAGVHPKVRQTLLEVIEDEVGHVDWVANELEAQRRENGSETVDRAMRRAEGATAAVFAKLRAHPIVRAYFGEEA